MLYIGMDCIQLDEFMYTVPLRSAVLDIKAQALMSYRCFNMIKESGRVAKENSKWSKKTASFPPQVTATRPQRLLGSMSAEGQARKEFMALMNKLTTSNKHSIIKQVGSCINVDYINIYIDIIWKICLDCPTYQPLYIELLTTIIGTKMTNMETIGSVFMDNLTVYITEKQYVPEHSPKDEEYDDFCDYVKWKKKALAMVSLVVALEQSMYISDAVAMLTEAVLLSCDEMLTSKQYDKVDPMLEQLISIYNSHTDESILNFVTKWFTKLDEMKPSTKFKFNEFQDILERNSRNCNIWRPKSLQT